ncbi:MAG: hypothetical protein ACT4QD_01060, partial [Acidobacteriota bacterium]
AGRRPALAGDERATADGARADARRRGIMTGVVRTPDSGDVTAGHLDRFRGALLGLAAGDALGTTVEFYGTASWWGDPLAPVVG